jgi:hypothetical protein
MSRAKQIAMIAVIAALLVAILVTKKRCADAVGTMFRVLDEEARRAAVSDGGLQSPSDMKH